MNTHGFVGICTCERRALASLYLGERTFQLHNCPIPRGDTEILLTAVVCRWELLMVQTPAQVLCVSMRMDPIVSYLLLLSLRWSTHSSVSWTERLSSCSYSSMQRRLNRMLNSCCDHKVLSLINVKGFDPEEVTVTVKDRKVKVLAEHEEEHTTATGTEYNYRNITKEISLPLGVSEDEVTYSLGPDSVVKIEMARRSHPCVLSR